MKNETIHYSPVDLLQEYCRELRVSKDPSFIEERFRWLIRLGQTLNFEYRWNGPLFRARKCIEVPRFRQITEMHYPPPHLCKPGRLNRSGAPLLYLSQNAFGALYEIRAQVGDRVQLIEYEIPEAVRIRCAVVGELTHVQRSGRASLSESLGKELIQFLKQLPHQACASFVFLDSFLASILRDPKANEDSYLHSATLAQVLFQETNDLQGIVYPSTVFEGGMNVAVAPEAADALIKARSSLWVVEEEYDFGLMKVRIEEHSVGHSTSGEIEWAGEKRGREGKARRAHADQIKSGVG